MECNRRKERGGEGGREKAEWRCTCIHRKQILKCGGHIHVYIHG